MRGEALRVVIPRPLFGSLNVVVNTILVVVINPTFTVCS